MKYGLTATEWDAAVDEIRDILIQIAKLRMTITYSELTKQCWKAEIERLYAIWDK